MAPRTPHLRGFEGLEHLNDARVRHHCRRREPTEAELDAAVSEPVAHMREQLQRAEMDDSKAAVREACRRLLRAWMALRERREEERHE